MYGKRWGYKVWPDERSGNMLILQEPVCWVGSPECMRLGATNTVLGEVYGRDEGAMRLARLIESAPHMLRIIRLMVQLLEEMGVAPEVQEQARRALDAAEGE